VIYFLLLLKEHGYREPISSLKELTKVIVQAVGYKVAKEILEMMQNGKAVPVDWSGELNLTYTFGGQLSQNR
jgi:hypothetical protein